MKNTLHIIFILLLSLNSKTFGQAKNHVSPVTAKPWTYWWWMGSSVTKEGISTNLTKMADAGIGGIHIIPIYGEKGDEQNYIPYLSSRWMEMLVHTVNEANRLNMGVDMTSGTGWPFGGPEIDLSIAAKFCEITTLSLTTLPQAQESISRENTAGYALYDDNGNCIYTGSSSKMPPPSLLNKADKIVMLHYRPTRQKVKRAAPGGEGLVIDVFSRDALTSYMDKFRQAFLKMDFGEGAVRAFYNDSYEVIGANYTTNFLEKFQDKRRYNLLPYLQVLADTTWSEERERLITDYCETISDLLLEDFTRTWVDSSHNLGLITRNQAHGSPGNLLDLYAASDIPETESFGASNFRIPGLVTDPDYDESHFGRPHPLTMKLASSAAHTTGKQLVSSETATWLADHFKVTLAQIKPQVDELFVSGINHIFYHGTTYSPPEKEFPGRLFYASTNFGPLSHFWDELPLLNRYITECQSILQASTPDNDLLLYFGVHDIWSGQNSRRFIRMFNVHHADTWFFSQNTGILAQKLWDQGYSFDYISDLGLQNDITVEDTSVKCGNNKYRAILVPALEYMPVETLDELLSLAKQGITIFFESGIPEKAPGLHQFEKKEAELIHLKSELEKLSNVKIIKDICSGLQQSGITRETIKDEELSFIRKKQGDKTVYFVTNLDDYFEEGWIELAKGHGYIEIHDIKNNTRGKALQKNGKVFLQLKPGNSCFLFCSNAPLTSEEYPYLVRQEKKVDISREWHLRAVKSLSEFPPEIEVDTLRSWTFYGEPFKCFSGTICYSKEFKLPAEMLSHEAWQLEVDQVKETAEVTINGELVGTIWSLPAILTIPPSVLREHNRIEINVTNTAFNQIIKLERKNTPWKNFHEIDFVDIRYNPYDASKKSSDPSGLIGKVVLVPCRLPRSYK